MVLELNVLGLEDTGRHSVPLLCRPLGLEGTEGALDTRDAENHTLRT